MKYNVRYLVDYIIIILWSVLVNTIKYEKNHLVESEEDN